MHSFFCICFSAFVLVHSFWGARFLASVFVHSLSNILFTSLCTRFRSPVYVSRVPIIRSRISAFERLSPIPNFAHLLSYVSLGGPAFSAYAIGHLLSYIRFRTPAYIGSFSLARFCTFAFVIRFRTYTFVPPLSTSTWVVFHFYLRFLTSTFIIFSIDFEHLLTFLAFCRFSCLRCRASVLLYTCFRTFRFAPQLLYACFVASDFVLVYLFMLVLSTNPSMLASSWLPSNFNPVKQHGLY